MINLGIVGASGLVGRTMLKVLEERNFPVYNLYLFGSSNSKGSTISFKGKDYLIEELTENTFDRSMDIALFSAGADVSRKYAPLARERGIIVIDNSSAWRMDPDVPLIVPEVNPGAVKNHKGIIANPNCSTIEAVIPLKALHDAYQIKRVVYSTYQAVSGSGTSGLEELERGLNGESPSFYPHQIAHNCLPHIDSFMEDGYSGEEMKMIWETRKILNAPDIGVTATTVRVPIKNTHGISINVEFEKVFALVDLRELLSQAEGVTVLDDPQNNVYPLATIADGTDHVYVGRIRRDYSVGDGLNLWVVADNVRKGAATNAVQIAELLFK